MRKIIIAAAALGVGLWLMPYAAAPAGAAPCMPGTPGFSGAACAACSASGMSGSACAGVAAPGAPPPLYFPDCEQYALPTDKAICVDQHLAGLR